MNLHEFEKESARTMIPHIHLLMPTESIHAIVGVASEAGELLDVVKKSLFYGQEPDLTNLREEIGDLMWYIMALVRSEGWDLEEILDENIKKLRLRYPDQFTQEHAALRLDKVSENYAPKLGEHK